MNEEVDPRIYSTEGMLESMAEDGQDVTLDQAHWLAHDLALINRTALENETEPNPWHCNAVVLYAEGVTDIIVQQMSESMEEGDVPSAYLAIRMGLQTMMKMGIMIGEGDEIIHKCHCGPEKN